MVLIISTVSDEHAAAVLRALGHLGVEAVLLDLSVFPIAAGLTLDYDSRDNYRATFDVPNCAPIQLHTCHSVWWRRPQPLQVDPGVRYEPHRHFAYNEAFEALAGLWQTLDVLWVNHPTRDEVAGRKAYQLRTAQRLGLEIPRTLITNDPSRARRFADELGYDRTVYKAFSATAEDWRETRLLRAGELDLMESVRYAPVIFQEYIEAEADLRITIVGGRLFPAVIFSQQTAYPVDFRMEMARARMEPAELPGAVADRLLALVDHLGLSYGAVDMRRTPEGRHVFLEINPAGQWLFVEQRTGLPITQSLAELLAGNQLSN